MTVLKIILLVYVVCESCQAYHRYGNLKSDHKNSLWSNKLYTGAPSSSSTASSLSWYRSNHRYGTTTTTQAPHHIRHSGYGSRYPKLDGVMHRLNPSKKTNPVHGKKSSDHLWDNYNEDNYYDEDDVLESMGKEEDIISDDDGWVSQNFSFFIQQCSRFDYFGFLLLISIVIF